MTAQENLSVNYIKEPGDLSPRIKWLRDYYFKGNERNWANEYTSWTTGTTWDVLYKELSYYIVPETYMLTDALSGSYSQAARKVELSENFWNLSLPERVAWFNREVMVNYLPKEILPGDLIAGARFNIITSTCFTEKESRDYNKKVSSKKGSRAVMKRFHDHGYGNAGATSGHIIPWHEYVLKEGWKGVHKDLTERLNSMTDNEKNSQPGYQIKAMITASTMPRDVAEKYSNLCINLAEKENDDKRKNEFLEMAKNLKKVPWEKPTTFWEALQALWINHMLVMSDENYPGPGISFGRIDQYLLPYWEYSINNGMDREFGKEIMKCFWVHSNTAYDAMIRNGNQGITAGFGQLLTLSGMGKDGIDCTNDLTYAMLEVIDEMSPILEPKPNVRIHRNTPEALLDKIIDMIASSQGAPFLLNFDERSMAGMMREAKLAKLEKYINEETVHEYAPVGCLENTMVGNDRSGTVDCNLNLVKAVELALNNGKDFIAYENAMTGKIEKIKRDGPATGNARRFKTWTDFYNAFEKQLQHIVKKIVDVYEASESIRSEYLPTPYLSTMVKGCAEQAKDINQGGPEINLVTIEAVTYATAVDSLLAIKYLVYDEKLCSMAELIKALKNNWKGFEITQAMAKNKAPKYGRDDDAADEMAKKVMDLWTSETWKYKTKSTNRQFRPGMLSWNYWAGDAHIIAPSANGRKQGEFLSNAICPSNGADINGPTSNSNSVGKVLGGREENGDWHDYNNSLPNGASHTITFNPSIVNDPEHREKFKAFIKGYMENGGTALQINMLDPEMLKEAQQHPMDFRHLLVRVTGYNAYFTTIGRELQNEVIARVSHNRF
jgi:pyruvate-formate lyase